MPMGSKVCFLTSVHPSPLETRIFYREAKTLAEYGYEIVFICQHDKIEVIEDVRIMPLPKPKNRLERMTKLAWKLFRLALKEKADIYHFHNPELIPVGLLLKILRKRVIYDVHEAFGEKILSKTWIKPPWLRPIVSKVFSRFEKISSKFFDHIMVADRFVAKQFKQRNVTVLANYPVLSMVKTCSSARTLKTKKMGKTIAIYSGGLTRDRGLLQMIEAVNILSPLDVELHLMGYFDYPKDEMIVKESKKVKYFGFLPLGKVFEHLMLADIGLALFQPVPAYFYAGENTNKLFEYMACGLPVIASDFPNLRKIIESSKCGICVDPTSPKGIAEAIRFLHENPEIRMELGENGKRSVLSKYNWEKESEKLLTVYKSLLERAPVRLGG